MNHLSEDQKHHLKLKLQNMLSELHELVVAQEQTSKPVQLTESIGRLSRIDAIQQQGIAQQALDRSKIRIKQVEAALTRIEKGTYGVCIKSDEPIPFERLDSLPEIPFLKQPEDD